MSQSTRAGTAAAATGKCTITLPVTGRGSTWIGTISVVNSPSSARWTLTLNGSDIAGLYGTSSYGPILWTGTEPLSLSSTGPTLVNGTTYRASLVGVEYATPKQVPTSIPTPASMAVTEITLKGGKIDIGSVTTIKVVESITTGNVTAGVINQTGTILQVGDHVDYLGTAANTVGAPFLSHSFTVQKAYSALAIVVVKTTGVPLVAWVQTSHATTGGTIPAPTNPISFISPFLTTQSVVPFATEANRPVVVKIYFSSATGKGRMYVYGLTSNPGVQLRSDGRTYPIGSLAAGTSTSTTTTLIAAPTSPLRIMVKSIDLDLSWQTASKTGVEFGYVQGTIDGSARVLLGCYAGGVDVGSANKSTTFPDGLLLDAGTALTLHTAKISGTTANVSCRGDVKHDLYV